MNRPQRGMTAAQAWVLGLTSVASLMVAVDALVVTTALPAIRVHLHTSLAGLEWTINAYVLSLAGQRGVQVNPDRGQRGRDDQRVDRDHQRRHRRQAQRPRLRRRHAPLWPIHLSCLLLRACRSAG